MEASETEASGSPEDVKPGNQSDLWQPALDSWEESADVWFHPNFPEYTKGTSFPGYRTLTALSIQAFQGPDGLPPILRDAYIMVFRLGQGRFALVKAGSEEQLRSLFLFDSEVFETATHDFDVANPEALGIYSLMKTHSERNLINLAVASGALAEALGLDEPRAFPPVAMLQSTFTFTVRPFDDKPIELEHQGGQVEVDGLFVASLQGRRTLFVLEAKNELAYTGGKSLSKTKLLYSALAAATHAPRDIPIVPVYLRASRQDRVAEFRVCRCVEIDRVNPALNAIEPEHVDAVRVEVPPL